MTRKEIIDRLCKKYPKEISPVDVEDMDKYLMQFDDRELDDIYEYVTLNYKYKTFVSIAFIKEFVDQSKSAPIINYQNDDILSYCKRLEAAKQNWNTFSIEKIIGIMKRLAAREISDMSMREKEFYAHFQDLLIEYNICEQQNYLNISQHLSYVLDCIKNNWSVKSISDGRYFIDGKRINKTAGLSEIVQPEYFQN